MNELSEIKKQIVLLYAKTESLKAECSALRSENELIKKLIPKPYSDAPLINLIASIKDIIPKGYDDSQIIDRVKKLELVKPVKFNDLEILKRLSKLESIKPVKFNDKEILLKLKAIELAKPVKFDNSDVLKRLNKLESIKVVDKEARESVNKLTESIKLSATKAELTKAIDNPNRDTIKAEIESTVTLKFVNNLYGVKKNG